jgi:hypothetical protein
VYKQCVQNTHSVFGGNVSTLPYQPLGDFQVSIAACIVEGSSLVLSMFKHRSVGDKILQMAGASDLADNVNIGSY